MSEELKEKFNDWNIKKQEIHFSDRTNKIYFKKGQIWWCSVGQNVGSESFGKGENFMRPILILKKLSSDLCVGLPLTSKGKTGPKRFFKSKRKTRDIARASLKIITPVFSGGSKGIIPKVN